MLELMGLAIIVALLILGVIVFGAVLHLIGYLVVGLIIGALGRMLLPGQQEIGLLATALYGIAGSIAGGLVADRILHSGSLVRLGTSVLCSAVLVALLTQKR